MFKQLVLAASIAAALISAAPAFADEARVVRTPHRVEVVPAPRRGYIWVPGDRVNHRRGHWIRDRSYHRHMMNNHRNDNGHRDDNRGTRY